MKLVYISHPYNGKEENVMDAERIARELQAAYPEVVFISPLHAVMCDYDGLDYETGLSYALEIMRRCDILYLSGDWKNSTGCMTEWLDASAIGMPQAWDEKDLDCLLSNYGSFRQYQEPGPEQGSISRPYIHRLIRTVSELNRSRDDNRTRGEEIETTKKRTRASLKSKPETKEA